MEESVDLHKEAGKENEQTLANLSPAEEATSKDEVKNQFCSFAFLFGHILNNLLTHSLLKILPKNAFWRYSSGFLATVLP